MTDVKIKLFSTIAASALTFLPVVAQADVTLINNSDVNATAEVPHFPLCTGPNPAGIIYKKSVKTVPAAMVARGCKNHEKACVGIIYMSDDCSGTPIAKITMNLAENSISVDNYVIDGYIVSASGTTLTLDHPS